jgi:uncharacterized damage-inducible protein DinB
MSIRAFYDQWPHYNKRIADAVAVMTEEQLALSHVAGGWPIWATVGHTAGARVYWLCQVVGEPGIEETPFPDPERGGWEDDPDTPRSADELVMALETTFVIVERCLERWTPEMLSETITRNYGGSSRDHTRGSILQRLFSHDAYHCGELSQTLGILDLPQIDLWRSD